MVYNITEKETQPTVRSHNNGTTEELLDRFAVSEIVKGWPLYRDASEWKNYRDSFSEEGTYIFTSELTSTTNNFIMPIPSKEV